MDNGVVISAKEMYDLIQEMTKTLQRIDSRLDVLEAKMESANRADERSREALHKAENAEGKAVDALNQLKALQTKVEDNEKWLFRTIAGALILGAIGALFYFAQN